MEGLKILLPINVSSLASYHRGTDNSDSTCCESLLVSLNLFLLRKNKHFFFIF